MLKNVLNIFSVSAISAGIRFVVEVIIARIVSVEAFGLFAIVTSLIAIFQVLVSGGVRPILQRKLAITFNNNNSFEFFEVLYKSLFLFFIVVLVVFSIYKFVDIRAINSESLSTVDLYFNTILIGSIATAILYMVSDIYRVIGNFKSFIFYKEAIFPIFFLIMVSLVWVFNLINVEYILYALIASLILSCVLGVVRLKHDLSKKNIATNKHELKIFKNKDLLMFWASSEVLGIMWIVRDKFAIFSVSEYMSAADIAVLFIMIRLIMPISMIKSSFNNIISPVIANLSHRRSFDKLSNKYSQLTKLLFLFVFPVFAILSTFGPEIVFIVLGEKYKLDLLPTSLLTWSVAVRAMLGPSGVALQMCGRPNIESIFLAGSLLAIVPLSMYLVPSFGLVGAILSVYMLITFVDLLRYFYVKKALHINAHEEKFGYKVILIMTIALLIIASNFLSPLYSLVSLILIYSMLFNKEIFSVVKNQKIFKY